MKYNLDNRIKDTALINLVDFENAIDLYEDGETDKALELMFGITILGLGGEFETDDREIRRLLRNREYTVEKSNKAYCNKVKAAEEKRVDKLQLREIAEMLANGATQQIIADTLGVSLRAIEYRIGVMRAEYPNIYSVSTKTTKTAINPPQPQHNDNVNDNVNDNDNVNVKENEKDNEKDNEKEKEKGKDFSYLYEEVGCDGYIRKEKKWLEKICWNFRTMSAQERIEYIEKLDFTHEEAEYIVNNILEI